MPESPHGGRAAGEFALKGSSPGSGRPNPTRGACAAAGSDGNGLPCAHSCLAHTPTGGVCSENSRRLLAQRAGAVIGTSYRNRGLNSLRVIVPDPSPLQHCARPVPVSRARPYVAAHQESMGSSRRGVSGPRRRKSGRCSSPEQPGASVGEPQPMLPEDAHAGIPERR